MKFKEYIIKNYKKLIILNFLAFFLLNAIFLYSENAATGKNVIECGFIDGMRFLVDYVVFIIIAKIMFWMDK